VHNLCYFGRATHDTSPWHAYKLWLIRLFYKFVGRLRAASESLFYYDVASGQNFAYYSSSRSYTPVFNIQPTSKQEQQAGQYCTVNGQLDGSCVYDYYATGNGEASRVTAIVYSIYSDAQNMLGLFIISLSFSSFSPNSITSIYFECVVQQIEVMEFGPKIV